jgi:hypothetical protein
MPKEFREWKHHIALETELKPKNWEETNRIQTYKICTFLEVDNFLP